MWCNARLEREGGGDMVDCSVSCFVRGRDVVASLSHKMRDSEFLLHSKVVSIHLRKRIKMGHTCTPTLPHRGCGGSG
jgi:hypothetical protein